MPNYVQVKIDTTDSNTREQLIALLSLMSFDGFEETEQSLLAFVDEKSFKKVELDTILKPFDVPYTTTIVPQQNWNALWESNFEPVVVDDFCAIRADFHPSFPHCSNEITITPKMSFGTGHHATTYQVISDMRGLDFKNKTVADFGTGTGILAILAEQLGASRIVAIDYDDWSIENTKENITRNGCNKIEIVQADNFSRDDTFDIILANINKNVILDNVAGLVDALSANGQLLLSGLLKSDESDVVTVFTENGLQWQHTHERNNWITIVLIR
jgi:ribosomal protein L11 methyltransferase